jgi:hypothetical protein
MRADIKMYRSALKNAIILLDPAPAGFAGAARVETRLSVLQSEGLQKWGAGLTPTKRPQTTNAR